MQVHEIVHYTQFLLCIAKTEAAVILWKKQDASGCADLFVDDTEKENKEHWTVLKMLRGHLEDVYDLSWSKCSQFLITGSVDNTAILWDVGKGIVYLILLFLVQHQVCQKTSIQYLNLGCACIVFLLSIHYHTTFHSNMENPKQCLQPVLENSVYFYCCHMIKSDDLYVY